MKSCAVLEDLDRKGYAVVVVPSNMFPTLAYFTVISLCHVGDHARLMYSHLGDGDTIMSRRNSASNLLDDICRFAINYAHAYQSTRR